MEKELATRWNHWERLIEVATGYGLELIAALAVLLFGWWLAGLAGATGLGLATAMATVLLLRSRSNRRRRLARSEG